MRRSSMPLTAHQKCALAGWAVSLVVSTAWIRLIVGCPVWPDVASSVASHILALSALWLDPRLLPPLGCALMGVCVGLMLVDMAFDLVIIREGSVRLGPTTVTPGRCAWLGCTAVAISVGCSDPSAIAPTAASTLRRASVPPPHLRTGACTCVCTRASCVDGVSAHAIVADRHCSSSARPPYPSPALSRLAHLSLPYAYPMPTMRLQAGGAPLLPHDAH